MDDEVTRRARDLVEGAKAKTEEAAAIERETAEWLATSFNLFQSKFLERHSARTNLPVKVWVAQDRAELLITYFSARRGDKRSALFNRSICVRPTRGAPTTVWSAVSVQDALHINECEINECVERVSEAVVAGMAEEVASGRQVINEAEWDALREKNLREERSNRRSSVREWIP